ncbi:neurochondrin homolog [Phlebotomus papatasi]|uniref:neurochondrin homolog n=1 Tax=Phlebotomus papatasi TaxID=29031 RepID=UPI002483CADD|nr:neurochondrin homolog [Phlebotomus papatasi]
MADSAIAEPIKKCVAILGAAKSDTEKFAALFMVTKLVKGKDCTDVAKKALFDSIGFKFLKKLMLADSVPDDCPPIVYKSVALSILTSFCELESLATNPDMLNNIPVFFSIIESADDEDDNDNLIVVTESYKCLQAIAQFEPGQKALLDSGAIPKLAQVYANKSFQTDEALRIIVTLCSKFGPQAWGTDPKVFNSLVTRIGLDFETDHSERKFDLCSILATLLFTCRRDVILPTVEGEIWPESIYKGLNDILKSKIGKNQRDPALKLAAQAVEFLGIEWTLNDEEKPKQFYLLLLQLAAIEVRMQMDNKSFNQAAAQADLITACFVILELSVNYMATDQLDLEQKEKQQVYTALKGAFSGVMSVLTKLSSSEARNSLSPKDKSFAAAMVRVLSAWLCQETTAMRPGLYQVLPYMFQLANSTFQESRQHRLEHKGNPDAPEGPADVLRVMLPALCHLAVEDKARQVLFKTKQDEALYECLVFHFSIAHWKRPPVPRAERLKRLNEPEPKPSPRQQEEMKDSRAAIVSLCNIFMNLTVLEAKIAEDSLLFSNLLKFIFENLPELKDTPDNLVMHGHLAVLGLLMLKQQAKKVKKNDFSICRYIQATIRFLWDAYIVDESNDPTALVVSITYKEHWMEIQELWFLGMQTMSGVITQIPWISEFALESGWAEGIVETLKKVKIGTLPGNVKSAFEDLLCQLAEANPDVPAKLKKADALRVCRNHRLMELGKKLFGD